MLIRFEPIDFPVQIVGWNSFLLDIGPLLQGWRPRLWEGPAPEAGIIIARDCDGGPHSYLLSAILEGPVEKYNQPIKTICAFLADLMTWLCDRDPDWLSLHAGAVEIGGKTVLFPAKGRSGKSTLTAELGLAGGRIFSDDVVPLAGEALEAVALGIAPRLRLPLPGPADSPLARHIASHSPPDGTRYAYVTLDADRLAPFGTRAPVGAIVILDRQAAGPGRPPRLEAASRVEALKQVIGQNMGIRMGSSTLMRRLHALVARIPVYTLIYEEAAPAARLLMARFGDPALTRPPESLEQVR